MLRLWQKSFWGKPVVSESVISPLVPRVRRLLTVTPIALLVALSLAIGIFSDTLFHWSELAAFQTLDRASYIAAVAPTDEMEYEGDAPEEHAQ
jgi:hypothetical protein